MSAIVKRTPIVPQTWEDIVSLATHVHQAGLCPEGIKTPQEAAVIILAGVELEISVMMSLRELYTVHKQVGMSTKLMAALIRRAGYTYRVLEQSPIKATTQIWRPDGKAFEPVTITMEQAVKARWHQSYDKETKQWKDKPMWVSCPDLMLMYRCLSRNIRTNAPDALMWPGTRDEIEDAANADAINGTAHIVEDEPEQKAPPAPEPETNGNGNGQPKGKQQEQQSPPHWARFAQEREAFKTFREKNVLTDIECKRLAAAFLGRESALNLFSEFPGSREELQQAIVAQIIRESSEPMPGAQA